jgi:hypothetical protein
MHSWHAQMNITRPITRCQHTNYPPKIARVSKTQRSCMIEAELQISSDENSKFLKSATTQVLNPNTLRNAEVGIIYSHTPLMVRRALRYTKKGKSVPKYMLTSVCMSSYSQGTRRAKSRKGTFSIPVHAKLLPCFESRLQDYTRTLLSNLYRRSHMTEGSKSEVNRQGRRDEHSLITHALPRRCSTAESSRCSRGWWSEKELFSREECWIDVNAYASIGKVICGDKSSQRVHLLLLAIYIRKEGGCF